MEDEQESKSGINLFRDDIRGDRDKRSLGKVGKKARQNQSQEVMVGGKVELVDAKKVDL